MNEKQLAFAKQNAMTIGAMIVLCFYGVVMYQVVRLGFLAINALEKYLGV